MSEEIFLHPRVPIIRSKIQGDPHLAYYGKTVIVAHRQATLLKERGWAWSLVNPPIYNSRPLKVKKRSTSTFLSDMPPRKEETVTKRLTSLERTLDPSKRWRRITWCTIQDPKGQDTITTLVKLGLRPQEIQLQRLVRSLNSRIKWWDMESSTHL